MKRRQGYNPKRQLAPVDEAATLACAQLAQGAAYKGNSQHKKWPNDYGLTPPTDPRPGKTLCDADTVFPKAKAEALLREGALRCMVSSQDRNGWPQNIWAVSESGEVFEAQLENSDQGHYHGYPMPLDDDFRKIVLDQWERRKNVSGN